MKFPSHIVLDISKKNLSNTSQYWIFKYMSFLKKSISFLDNLSIYKKYLLKKETLMSNKILNNQKNFTVRYNYSNAAIFLNDEEKNFVKKVYEPRLKVKRRFLESRFFGQEAYDFITNPEKKFDEKALRRLIKNFYCENKIGFFTSNNLWSLFDINFLRKERIYTKLKYSRVPQYDIVSGGAAALFAGFLGFLICEKFGFELVDSGDFYFLFMYLVFLFFFCRLFLKIMEFNTPSWNIISLKWLIFFYRTLLILILKFFNSFFKK